MSKLQFALLAGTVVPLPVGAGLLGADYNGWAAITFAVGVAFAAATLIISIRKIRAE